MSKQSLPSELDEIIANVQTAPVFAHYRRAAKEVRRTGRPQIVRTGEVSGVPYVDRLHPIAYRPSKIPKSQRYEREAEEAEKRLHDWICTEADWRSVPEITRPIREAQSSKGRVKWGENYRGSWYHEHTISQCEGPGWTRLEKQRGELHDGLAAAAGRMPELAQYQPWAGAFLVREYGRRNRRGRPSLKWPWYSLAADYRLAVIESAGKLPHGFYPALARHLSATEFGVIFNAQELKTRTRDAEKRTMPLGAPAGRSCE